jgi:hypothetical protein
MTEAVPSLYAAMVEFFRADQWPYLALAGSPALTMNFEGQHARWTCYAQVREDEQQFIFYSLCPVIIPEDKRADVLEFITRANYGLIIGNFEMDLDTGEVRYKTSFDGEGVPVTAALFKNTIYPNLAMLDQFLPGVLALVYGEGAAAESAAAEGVAFETFEALVG